MYGRKIKKKQKKYIDLFQKRYYMFILASDFFRKRQQKRIVQGKVLALKYIFFLFSKQI